jgi:hypothetical protein
VSRSVVKQDIPWGGVLVHTRGQVVENDVVEAQGWQDYVVGENTKEAREIKAEVSGRDVSDFEPESTSSRSSSRASAKNEQEG